MKIKMENGGSAYARKKENCNGKVCGWTGDECSCNQGWEEKTEKRLLLEEIKKMIGTDVQDISPTGVAYNQALSDVLALLDTLK